MGVKVTKSEHMFIQRLITASGLYYYYYYYVVVLYGVSGMGSGGLMWGREQKSGTGCWEPEQKPIGPGKAEGGGWVGKMNTALSRGHKGD